MAFRFRRSVRLFPGVRINLTKRGASSVSIGRRGAHVTFSDKGTRATIGVPGTGVSYSEFTPYSERPALQKQDSAGSTTRAVLALMALVAMFVALAILGV
jgi:hypothetical protein